MSNQSTYFSVGRANQQFFQENQNKPEIGDEEMVAVYVGLIVAGKRTINQVPASLKELVKEALIALDLPQMTEEESEALPE